VVVAGRAVGQWLFMAGLAVGRSVVSATCFAFDRCLVKPSVVIQWWAAWYRINKNVVWNCSIILSRRRALRLLISSSPFRSISTASSRTPELYSMVASSTASTRNMVIPSKLCKAVLSQAYARRRA